MPSRSPEYMNIKMYQSLELLKLNSTSLGLTHSQFNFDIFLLGFVLHSWHGSIISQTITSSNTCAKFIASSFIVSKIVYSQ